MTTETRGTEAPAISRRTVLGTLVTGATVLVATGTPASALAQELLVEDSPNAGQWLAWDDGYDYPIERVTPEGQWVIVDDESRFDGNEYLVDPHGWVCDGNTWFPIAEVTPDGVWYSDGDGYDWLLEFAAARE